MQVTELIKACADSDQAMPWEAFVRRYQRAISLSVLRILSRSRISSPDLVEDLVQDTYLKLCNDRFRQILRFALKHPEAVDGYIKMIAANVARDHIKSQRSAKRGGGEVVQFPEFVEPIAKRGSAGGEDSIRSAVLMRELEECLDDCTTGKGQTRDRLIFWLHYRQGMTAKAIADLPAIGLSTKGVESAIFRLTRQIKGRLGSSRTQPGRDSVPAAKGFGRAESY